MSTRDDNEREECEKRDEFHRQLRSGNPWALEYLFQLAPRVEYSLRLKFGALIPDEDLYDIVGGALIRVFEQGARFNPLVASIETWVNRQAHYEAMTFLRKRQHISSRSLDELGHELAFNLENLENTLSDELSDNMNDLLQRLIPARQIVIRLRHVDGLTIDEIAQTLGISQGAVKVRLHRAYHDLRRFLDSD